MVNCSWKGRSKWGAATEMWCWWARDCKSQQNKLIINKAN
jgi:hypothetical protein